MPELPKENPSPLMQQWEDVKKQLPKNTLLFVEIGDFMEVFKEDAKIVAKAIETTLTHRNHIPMTGISKWSWHKHSLELLHKGYTLCVLRNTAKKGQPTNRTIDEYLKPSEL
jgi:DNA mismatch repair protein MutS